VFYKETFECLVAKQLRKLTLFSSRTQQKLASVKDK